MPENYTLRDMHGTGKEEVKVRLVGVITDFEAKAVLNVKNAARMVSTSNTIEFPKTYIYCHHKYRFVIVVRTKSPLFENKEPIIYISPIICSAVSYADNAWHIRFMEKSISKIFEFSPIRKKDN